MIGLYVDLWVSSHSNKGDDTDDFGAGYNNLRKLKRI